MRKRPKQLSDLHRTDVVAAATDLHRTMMLAAASVRPGEPDARALRTCHDAIIELIRQLTGEDPEWMQIPSGETYPGCPR